MLVTAVFGQTNQAAATIVRCDPALKVALVDEKFTIDIYVEDVEDLRSIDVRMSYDPAQVEPVDGDPQSDGINLEPVDDFFTSGFFLRNGYNLLDGAGENVPIWYAALQQGVGSNGSGSIARMHFKPLKVGQFEMVMLQTKLAAFRGAPIAHSNQNCIVNIVERSEQKIIYLPAIFAR